MIGQADDRVDDDLARSVKRDVPTPVAGDDLDMEVAKLAGRRLEVPCRFLGAAAVGDGGRVLDQQDGLLGAFEDLGMNLLLAAPGGVVVEEIQVDDPHGFTIVRAAS